MQYCSTAAAGVSFNVDFHYILCTFINFSCRMGKLDGVYIHGFPKNNTTMVPNITMNTTYIVDTNMTMDTNITLSSINIGEIALPTTAVFCVLILTGFCIWQRKKLREKILSWKWVTEYNIFNYVMSIKHAYASKC